MTDTNLPPIPCGHARPDTVYATCPRDVHGADGDRCDGCLASREVVERIMRLHGEDPALLDDWRQRPDGTIAVRLKQRVEHVHVTLRVP